MSASKQITKTERNRKKVRAFVCLWCEKEGEREKAVELRYSPSEPKAEVRH